MSRISLRSSLHTMAELIMGFQYHNTQFAKIKWVLMFNEYNVIYIRGNLRKRPPLLRADFSPGLMHFLPFPHHRMQCCTVIVINIGAIHWPVTERYDPRPLSSILRFVRFLEVVR